jgi:hypothetical protein
MNIYANSVHDLTKKFYHEIFLCVDIKQLCNI